MFLMNLINAASFYVEFKKSADYKKMKGESKLRFLEKQRKSLRKALEEQHRKNMQEFVNQNQSEQTIPSLIKDESTTNNSMNISYD